MLRDSASRAPRPLYQLGYICDQPYFLIVVWTQRHSPTHLHQSQTCPDTFEHFLQTYNFIEPLPDGMAQFTGMMASIIQDVYHINLDLVGLKQASKEMKDEG